MQKYPECMLTEQSHRRTRYYNVDCHLVSSVQSYVLQILHDVLKNTNMATLGSTMQKIQPILRSRIASGSELKFNFRLFYKFTLVPHYLSPFTHKAKYLLVFPCTNIPGPTYKLLQQPLLELLWVCLCIH